MDILKYIDGDTLLIIPRVIKNRVLELLSENDKLFNIKIMDFDEIKKKLLFDYNDKSLNYIASKYHLKLEVAKTLIDNIYYVENKEYKSKKLEKLVNIKNDLKDNNLLIEDKLFSHLLIRKNVLIYGYDYIDNFNMKLVSIMKPLTNVKIIKKEYSHNKFNIYEFNTIDEEVNYIFHQISTLLHKGIDINKIKLAGVNKEYYFYLHKYSLFYQIPIELNDKKSIYETALGIDFINHYKEFSNVDDSLSFIENNYILNNENNKMIYNMIINIINNLDEFNINILEYKFKNTYLPRVILDNALREIELKDNYFEQDNYVFLMSFNNEFIPLIHKDDEYITDNIKNMLDMETSLEKNEIEIKTIVNIINNISNLTITYKLSSVFNSYSPSSLIENLNVLVTHDEVEDIHYTKNYDKLELSKLLDNYIKYGEYSDKIDILSSNIDIDYLKYDNTYKQINKEKLAKYLNNKLSLSYSSLDTFYHCHFRYYIESILNLSIKEDNMTLLIGNLFHYVLDSFYKPNFDFDLAWNSFLHEYKLTSKESVLLDKLNSELKFIIKVLDKQKKYTKLNKYLLENRLVIDKSRNNYDIKFKGIIDKINYFDDEDKTIISVVDYKTGNMNIDLTNIKYGLSMQLPIYLYLIERSKIFTNPIFGGFYLQRILHNEIIAKSGKTYEELKTSNLELYGYSNSDKDILKYVDEYYFNSEFIHSLKIVNDHFSTYSKVLDNSQIEKIIKLTDRFIDGSIDKIINADFRVNPRRIGKDLIGCKYCKYKSICYMKEADIINLEEVKDLSFLNDEVTL